MRKTLIKVEASKTKNYQKYTVGLETEFIHNDDETLNIEIKRLQTVCRKRVMEQISLD